MGRTSRDKALRRSGVRLPTEKEAERASLKANRRARRVGDTIEEFERVAAHSPERLAETLISRYTIRMDNLPTLPTWYRANALESIVPTIALDMVHRRLGVPVDRLPTNFHGGWLNQLVWGVDSAVASCRLLLVGQIPAAAVVARQQLERWTLLSASIAGIERGDDESVQEFIARTWTGFVQRGHTDYRPNASDEAPEVPTSFGDGVVETDEPEQAHEHVHLSDGTEICPSLVYGVLSEIIHANLCQDSLAWEVIYRLGNGGLADDVATACDFVGQAITLSILQIKLMTAAVALRRGEAAIAHIATAAPDRFSAKSEDQPMDTQHPLAALGFEPAPDSSTVVTPPPASLMPLMPNEGLRPAVLGGLADMTAVYEKAVLAGKRPAGRLYRDDELTSLVFAAHRNVSAAAAQSALKNEQRMRSSSFDVEGLTWRGTSYILVSELAGMCARWSQSDPNVAAAASAVSSSLRSAFWLWLEDDDRAMAILRCTLEQTARVRVWHRKRSKAERLESSPATTPRDWIDAASWRRLAALNRAFGEFAHAHHNPRWDGARMLLTALQLDPDSSTAPFTARGAALDFVSTLAARVMTDLIEENHSAVVGSTARTLLADHCGFDMTPGETTLDRALNHMWQHRSTPLERTPFPMAWPSP
ncbi:hypothetical protein [Rhodococcus sp. NPDC057529]|uniref:hypothetical protein n=1 Tax=Rhodococcus sp. NPDC057529 TaxID=3346158 RepID=UPI00366FDFF6